MMRIKMYESEIPYEVADKWVKTDVEGDVVSTNRDGLSLLCHNDSGLNSDVFHWSVVDQDGDMILNTGKLYYGSDVIYDSPSRKNRSGYTIFCDAIYLKCIVDEYGFNELEVLNYLDSKKSESFGQRFSSCCGKLREKGRSPYGRNYDEFNIDSCLYSLEKATKAGILNQFKK